MRMTLERLLLEKLAKWRFSTGRQTLEAIAGKATFSMTADCADEVGCRLWEVALTRPTPSEAVADRARRLVDQATGLLEPLQLLEVDGERHVALLRSNRPATRDGQLAYYELLLGSDGSSHVRRYQAARDGSEKRQQINFSLTHETLAKLASDLVSC
jgi:hypothetical protein